MNDFFGKKVLCLIKPNIILKGIVQDTSVGFGTVHVLIIETPTQHKSWIGTTMRFDKEDVATEDEIKEIANMLEERCWFGNVRLVLNLNKHDHERVSFAIATHIRENQLYSSFEMQRVNLNSMPPILPLEELSRAIIAAMKPYTLNPTAIIPETTQLFSPKNPTNARMFIDLYFLCNLGGFEPNAYPGWTKPGLFNFLTQEDPLGVIYSKLLLEFKENNTKNSIGKLIRWCANVCQSLKMPNYFESSSRSSSSSSSSLNMPQITNLKQLVARICNTILVYHIPGKYRKLVLTILDDVINGRDLQDIHPLLSAFQKHFNLQPNYNTTFKISSIKTLKRNINTWDKLNKEALIIETAAVVNCFIAEDTLDYAFNDNSFSADNYCAFLLICCWAIRPPPLLSSSSSSLSKKEHTATSVNIHAQADIRHVDTHNQVYRRAFHNNAAVSSIQEQHDTLHMFYQQQLKLAPLFKVVDITPALGSILSRLVHEVIPEPLIDDMIAHWMAAKDSQFISYKKWAQEQSFPSTYSYNSKIVNFYHNALQGRPVYILTLKDEKLVPSEPVVSIYTTENLENNILQKGDPLHKYFSESPSDGYSYVFVPLTIWNQSDVSPYWEHDNPMLSTLTCVPFYTDFASYQEHQDNTIRFDLYKHNTFDFKEGSITDVFAEMWEREYNKRHKAFDSTVLIHVTTSTGISFWFVRRPRYCLKNVDAFLGFYLIMDVTYVPYPALALMTYDAWISLGPIKFRITDLPDTTKQDIRVFAHKFTLGCPYYENKEAYNTILRRVFLDIKNRLANDPIQTANAMEFNDPPESISSLSERHKDCVRFLLGKKNRILEEHIQYMRDLLSPIQIDSSSQPSPSSSSSSFSNNDDVDVDKEEKRFSNIATEKLIFFRLYRANTPSPSTRIPTFIGYPYVFIQLLVEHAQRVLSWHPFVSFTTQYPKTSVQYGPYALDISDLREAISKVNDEANIDNLPSDSIRKYPELFRTLNLTMALENDTDEQQTHPFVFNRDDIHLLLWNHYAMRFVLHDNMIKKYNHEGEVKVENNDDIRMYYNGSLPSFDQFYVPVTRYVTFSSNNYLQYTEEGKFIEGNLDFISRRNEIKLADNFKVPTLLQGYAPDQSVHASLVFDEPNRSWSLKKKNMSSTLRSVGILLGMVQPIKVVFNSKPALDTNTLYHIADQVWFQFVSVSTEASVSTGESYFVVFGYEIDATQFGNAIKYVSYDTISQNVNAKFVPMRDTTPIPDHPGLCYWELVIIDNNENVSEDLVVLHPEHKFQTQVPIMTDFFSLPIF